MASRASARSIGYRCAECGWTTVKWVGRCGECQAWGSVAEVGVPTIRTTAASSVARPALRIGQVDVEHAAARSTGVSELDRVLGGGLVPGAVVLVAGEPGIGKSTLLLIHHPAPATTPASPSTDKLQPLHHRPAARYRATLSSA